MPSCGRARSTLVTLLLFGLPHLVKKVIFVALQACTPQPTERAPAAPENEPLRTVIAFRPSSSSLYLNADVVLQSLLARIQPGSDIGLARLRLRPTSHAVPHKLDTLSPSAPTQAELVVCDLSASPHVDLARMLHQLQDELAARGIALLVGLIGCKLWMTYWVGPLRAVCKPEASGARALLR